ncbi:MAG: small acid-soluble spore protein Tlp [Syntrophomonadaceae bacterium]|nr:small acid-soluble spore protein Tlp [Syntrophomonadaceae bacterium]
MKHKPDDRRDNVERIQQHIDDTIQNIEAAEEMITATDNPRTRSDLEKKNQRREKALDSMRQEIRDEALDRQKD